MLITRKQLKRYLVKMLNEAKSAFGPAELARAFGTSQSSSNTPVLLGDLNHDKRNENDSYNVTLYDITDPTFNTYIQSVLSKKEGLRDDFGGDAEAISESIIAPFHLGGEWINLNDALEAANKTSGATPQDSPAADLGKSSWPRSASISIESDDPANLKQTIVIDADNISVKSGHVGTRPNFGTNVSTLTKLAAWCLMADKNPSNNQLFKNKFKWEEYTSDDLVAAIRNGLGANDIIKMKFGLLYYSFNPYKPDNFTTQNLEHFNVSPKTNTWLGSSPEELSIPSSGLEVDPSNPPTSGRYQYYQTINDINEDLGLPSMPIYDKFGSNGIKLYFSMAGGSNQLIKFVSYATRVGMNKHNNVYNGIKNFYKIFAEAFIRTYFEYYAAGFFSDPELELDNYEKQKDFILTETGILISKFKEINQGEISISDANIEKFYTNYFDTYFDINPVTSSVKVLQSVDPNYFVCDVYYAPPENNIIEIGKNSIKWNNNSKDVSTKTVITGTKNDYQNLRHIARINFNNINKTEYMQFRGSHADMMNRSIDILYSSFTERAQKIANPDDSKKSKMQYSRLQSNQPLFKSVIPNNREYLHILNPGGIIAYTQAINKGNDALAALKIMEENLVPDSNLEIACKKLEAWVKGFVGAQTKTGIPINNLKNHISDPKQRIIVLLDTIEEKITNGATFDPIIAQQIRQFFDVLTTADKNLFKSNRPGIQAQNLISENKNNFDSEFLKQVFVAIVFEDYLHKVKLIKEPVYFDELVDYLESANQSPGGEVITGIQFGKTSHGNETATMQNLNTQKEKNVAESKTYEKILKKLLKYTK